MFRAGTQTTPYNNKLTFILDGDSTGTQSLGFGNKVIGCYACTFDMNGKARDQTWGELSASVAVGDTQIVLATAADWQVGEEIVIASTGFDHKEAEVRTIKTIAVDKKTITFDKPLVYAHLG